MLEGLRVSLHGSEGVAARQCTRIGGDVFGMCSSTFREMCGGGRQETFLLHGQAFKDTSCISGLCYG